MRIPTARSFRATTFLGLYALLTPLLVAGCESSTSSAAKGKPAAVKSPSEGKPAEVKSPPVRDDGEQPLFALDGRAWWEDGDKACPEGAHLQTRSERDGTETVCVLPDGHEHGRAIFRNGEGRPYCEDEYFGGKLHGRRVLIREDGSPSAVERYREGVLHGLSVRMYPNGVVERRERYRHGVSVGQVTEYDEQGGVESTGSDNDCLADDDCRFEDPCDPQRCVADPWRERGEGPVCKETTAPRGSCVCLYREYGRKCALRPEPMPKPTVACQPSRFSREDSCGLDLAAGECFAPSSERRSDNRGWVNAGPYCACEKRGCQMHWVEPVACGERGPACFYIDERAGFVFPVATEPKRKKQHRVQREGDPYSVCMGGQCALTGAEH